MNLPHIKKTHPCAASLPVIRGDLIISPYTASSMDPASPVVGVGVLELGGLVSLLPDWWWVGVKT